MELLLGAVLLVLVTGVVLPPRVSRAAASDDPALIERRGALATIERIAAGALPERMRSALAADIELAGIAHSTGRVVTLTVGSSVLLAVLVAVVTTPVLGILVGVLAPIGTPIAIRAQADRLRRRFEDQLSDTLQLLASSLRAGNSLLKSLDTVAEEAAQPSAREFVRAVNEVRVGSDVGDALDHIAERMGSADFSWVSQAVDIHREVGGNLAEVLDRVSQTLRERNQMRRQVQSLSADGRLSAWVLMALPLAIPLLLTLINPGFLAPMFSSPLGWVLLGISAALLITGALWIRKLVAIPL